MRIQSVTLLTAMMAISSTVQAIDLEPAPATLVLPVPGYVQLDGRWYAYDAPAGQLPGLGVHVLAQPVRDGFFLQGFLSALSCQRVIGGPLSVDGLLEHAESSVVDPAGAVPLYRRPGPPPVLASVSVRSCLGTTAVLQLASAHGDLICSGEVAAPFTREECPPLQNPLIILGDGFESLPAVL